jgi:alkanesulfonate monooxygenase SsuD/methylene tetrahydromethanopterin reductase-like flavin-dependent oxidoreductase (luciferase family)
MSVALPLRFGALTFQVLRYEDLRDDVRFLEQAGFDAAWLADQIVPVELPVMEAWTTLAALAANTERIRLGTLVTNVAMRNPAMVARQANTVDQVSGGRLELGIGAGYFEDEHRWLGIDYLDGRGRVDRLIEAAEILDEALRGGRVTYSGTHFRLDDAPTSPPPVQQPRPPLWIAARAPRSLRVAVRLADGVAAFGDHGLVTEESVAAFRKLVDQIQEACAAAGRDPRTLRIVYLAGFADERPFASTDAATDFIGRFAEAGATDFAFTMYNPAQPGMADGAAAGRYAGREQLEQLAADVLPRLRLSTHGEPPVETRA